MPKRKNFISAFRRIGKWPNGYISRNLDDKVTIVYGIDRDRIDQIIVCNGSDARLIAKRINQFLDAGG